MAFTFRAESNANGSIFYLPDSFENYLENVHTTANVPNLFADDFFGNLPVNVRVPNQHPPAPAPQIAPGTPPQAPPAPQVTLGPPPQALPPANNMGAAGSNDDNDDDDDDDQSFSGEDDAPCGDNGDHLRGDGCTVTDTAIGSSNVQTTRTTFSLFQAPQIIPSTVNNQTNPANFQTTQTTANNCQAFINLRRGYRASHSNHVNGIRFPPALAEDDFDDDDYDDESDILSVLGDDTDEPEAELQQRYNNQNVTTEGSGPRSGSGGGEEPTPSSKDTFTLRANSERPNFSLDQLRDSPIASMLPEFLARMESANRELEAERVAGTLVDRSIEVDENQDASENGQYIEMNLGLGVFEEQNDDTSTSSDSEATSNTTGEDIMQRLLGGKRKRDAEGEKVPEIKKPKIEEL